MKTAMTNELKNLIHGRESYIVHFGPDLIMKRPLPTLGDDARDAWLNKQHHTKDAIDDIRAVDNPRYNIPRMIFIKDDEYQLLEECAPGYHLTPELFKTLSRRQQYEIIDGIASFLVDMNELKPVQDLQKHKIADELKFDKLDHFIENKMHRWFDADEIKQMAKIRDNIGTFEYETRPAWSHCDLNSGNVLYDPKTSTLSFIDFAESDYRFIYRDIFAPVQIELGICRRVYETYYKLHDHSKYSMPAVTNENLRQIMKYRVMCAMLRRFIKAADDLRPKSTNEKTIVNNIHKISFMRDQMSQMQDLEKQFSR